MIAFYIALVLGGLIATAYIALGYAEFQRARQTARRPSQSPATIWTHRVADSPGSRSAGWWSPRRCWC